jgi:acyl-homoserine-lactone acylase
VEQSYGALDVPWGDVFRLRRDSVDLPASGAGDELGSFRVLDFERAGNQYLATGGDSFVALIEFSRPVRALALLPYGNSSQPGSVHRTDQLGLFARREMRQVWWQRADILAHLKERKRF